MPRPVRRAKFNEGFIAGATSEEAVRDNRTGSRKRANIKADTGQPKPVYTEEFTFRNSDVPVEISLEKIPDELIPIENVKKEVQEAYNQGFSDGQDTTTATFKTQIRQHQKWLKNLDSVINELRSAYSKEIVSLEDSVVELAVMVAEHILEHEISDNSKIVVDQTRKAIGSLDRDIIFKIHLHPENIEILESVKSKLINDSSVMKKVELIANTDVDQGGCILETSAGIVDARLKTQLERVRQVLKENTKKPPSVEE